MKKVPELHFFGYCVGTKVVTIKRTETKEKDKRKESRTANTADEP